MTTGTITCGECRFWVRGQENRQEGECLLASDDMAIGNGRDPLMRAQVDETGTRGSHVLDDSPVALLRTQSDFSCVHADLRGDLEEPVVPARISARQEARFGERECRWEETLPGEHLYRCSDRVNAGHPELVWPSCEECPFLQEAALRSRIVNQDGEIIAENERDHVSRHLSRALDHAQESLGEVMRLERIIRVMDGRRQPEDE